jgi:CheY-like chemotaxis protein
MLVDCMMPGVDGFALAEEACKLRYVDETTLMMLSSAVQSEYRVRSREVGFDAYLTKPIKQSELLDSIMSHLRGAARFPSEAVSGGAERRAAAQTPADVRSLAAASTEAAPPLQARRSLRILLAEDSMVNQKLARRLLENWGHTVTVAHNGNEALRLISQHNFELVLMDVQMPEIDGLEVTERIREDEAGSRVRLPIIAMTAHAMQGDRERCLEAGMDAYVSKPIRPAELFSAIESFSAHVERAASDGAASAAPLPDAVAYAPGDGQIDRAALLKTMGDSPELVRELCEVCQQECSQLLQQMQTAIVAKDATGAARAAHALKGAVGTFEVAAVYDAAQRLEALARRGSCEGLAEAFAELDGELARFIGELGRVANAPI